MKIVYFSEIFAAYNVKVGRCIELNGFMGLMIEHEYQVQGHSLTRKSCFSFETK